MSLNLATIVHEGALRRGDRTALISGDRSFSYRDLCERSRRLAGGLASLGVRRGQHVALMLPNVPDFPTAYFACHYLGAPVVPLNVLLTAEEIAYHLSDSDAVALIVSRDLLPQAMSGFHRAGTCRTMVLAGHQPAVEGSRPPGGVSSLEALMDGSSPVAELPDTMPDDTAVVLYTSGTTGRPKGAELTHFNLFYNADLVSGRLLPLGAGTTALCALPLFHSFGQTVMQNAVLMRGGTLVLVRRFEAGDVLRQMSRRRVTFFAGVPTMYFALLHHPEAAQHDLSSLRFCKSGGSAMPVEVMSAFDQTYGVSIREGYGLSETSPVASFNLLDRPKKPGSIGLPIEGVEFRLVDEQGRIVTEPLVPGEIYIKGHNVMKGYYKRPEATAEAIKDGWFHTGDVGHRDEDGYYFIVDRKKDMILRGGFNVYPREVEEVLYGHPAVVEAAVVSVKHDSLGEEVKAILVLKPGLSAAPSDIIDYCRERLAAYKYPRLVEFRASLPKGPTGKILKRELRG